ncbi:hypothetical protein ES705_22405 [subsurface metagenome]
MMNDELESLLVSGKEVDKKLVAAILEPYLRIDKETCDIRPLSSWSDLKANIKILLYLIARKAMVALGLPLATEGASATEIMQKTGMKKGTVNPALRDLFNDRVIEQFKDKKYYVPNHAIEKVKVMISEGQRVKASEK